MRKAPQHDNALNDHIKELWIVWNNGTDLHFNQDHDFCSLLIGYFASYYKGDNTHVEDAIDYFLRKKDEWEREDDKVEDSDDLDNDWSWD